MGSVEGQFARILLAVFALYVSWTTTVVSESYASACAHETTGAWLYCISKFSPAPQDTSITSCKLALHLVDG